ncbi:hypothetical protein FACS1894167_14500 [Synergistales bacterium]|nr:hypothetical protein FACS1894167_14500 [Synergistales bacterium]
MKPMNIDFLSEIGKMEEDSPIVCNSASELEEMSPLGALVWNARIYMKLTAEDFAEKCDIDVNDVERIENDSEYAPDIRTLGALSMFLKIKNDVLAELGGYFKKRDPLYWQKIYSFAASSRMIRNYTDENTEVFEQYLAVLHERSTSNE